MKKKYYLFAIPVFVLFVVATIIIILKDKADISNKELVEKANIQSISYYYGIGGFQEKPTEEAVKRFVSGEVILVKDNKAIETSNLPLDAEYVKTYNLNLDNLNDLLTYISDNEKAIDGHSFYPMCSDGSSSTIEVMYDDGKLIKSQYYCYPDEEFTSLLSKFNDAINFESEKEEEFTLELKNKVFAATSITTIQIEDKWENSDIKISIDNNKVIISANEISKEYELTNELKKKILAYFNSGKLPENTLSTNDIHVQISRRHSEINSSIEPFYFSNNLHDDLMEIIGSEIYNDFIDEMNK